MDIVKSMYADTIEERYSLIDDDDVSGDDSFVDSVISQWMSRNCALRPDDFAGMLELRGYDKKKYAKCIDGKSFLRGNKGNLSSWYSDFEKIFAFFSKICVSFPLTVQRGNSRPALTGRSSLESMIRGD